ncbi:MAG: hypothetical protein B7733_07960 [Myxococcales bacterium FL481]|nr:MAG: hypothetical protein B7733_07960 [Myxococcales bacterium FL481]
MTCVYQRLGPWLLVSALVGPACEQPAAPPAAPPGPACRALLDAATRASACDPPLALVDEQNFSDEPRCRQAIARLLDREPLVAEITSLYGHEPREATVTEADLTALRDLALPASLSLRPDLPAGPGVPMTSAKLAERGLTRAQSGALEIHAQAGRHLLRIAHAGVEQSYCVRLAQCQRLELTVHGSRLAAHPHIDAGTCEPLTTTRTQPLARRTHSLTRR